MADLEWKLQEKDSERIAAESARQLTQKAVEGLADSKRQLSRENMDLRHSTDAEFARIREELMVKDETVTELQQKVCYVLQRGLLCKIFSWNANLLVVQ